MALDLNKPIGVSASSASMALPTKKTMNLLVRERKTRGAWKYVLAALGLALLVGLFAKFAVFDVLAQVDLKRSELYAAQQELSAVQSQLENYDAILEEYRSYTGIASDGSTDALVVMNMVATLVQPRATVTAASTSDGSLLVNVKDITLDDLGKLADALRNDAMVADVAVTTASDISSKSEEGSESTNKVSATLQITLSSGAEEGGN
ncbi:MAG: hypothetical protein IJ113_05340 [Eggerthellaceae bacterium]|nr:hypothetical protein [Eggerthellaceae bacterium]